jgi:putative chitobiose transport system substrate-binding protein
MSNLHKFVDPMPLSRRKILQASLLFSLGACTAQSGEQSQNSSNKSQNGNRILFWTMQLKPSFNQYMTDLIADFTQQNPGSEVEWVDIPWSEMENKILTAIAAQTAPDVVNLNPQFASKLAGKNAFVDMQKRISESERELYFPNIWKANQLEEQVFGLPWYVATDINIYNRQIFTKAGLDPQRPPKTYAELAKVAAKIKAKTGKFAFMLSMDGSQVLESMVQMGMELLGSDRRAAFNNPKGKAAFQYWVDLFGQKLIPREILTDGHRKAVELYQAGELAMLLTGPQFLKLVSQNAPDIAKVTDVAAQIVGENGKKSAAVMNVAVPSSSGSIDLAVKFALFLTNDQNQLSFSKIENSLPSTKRSATDPYFTNLSTTSLIGDKARVISAAQLANSEVLLPPSQNLDELRKIIYSELQLAMLGKKNTIEAIAAAEEKWNSSI